MKDDIEQLLKSLHLRKIAEIFDAEVRRAETASASYQELVARLLRAQWQANQESALAWRIKRAGLPEQWTLETFPFKRQPGVSQRQIRAFAELEFVGKAENIVFIGPTGVGCCVARPEAGLVADRLAGRGCPWDVRAPSVAQPGRVSCQARRRAACSRRRQWGLAGRAGVSGDGGGELEQEPRPEQRRGLPSGGREPAGCPPLGHQT